MNSRWLFATGGAAIAVAAAAAIFATAAASKTAKLDASSKYFAAPRSEAASRLDSRRRGATPPVATPATREVVTEPGKNDVGGFVSRLEAFESEVDDRRELLADLSSLITDPSSLSREERTRISNAWDRFQQDDE